MHKILKGESLMSEQKKGQQDKPVSAKEPWPKKDVPPFTKGHSQDADRHSKHRHPVSDK
jgi:hypothetical protein